MQQLAHCGTDEGLLGLASGEQGFISGFDMRVGLNEMKPNITGDEHIHYRRADKEGGTYFFNVDWAEQRSDVLLLNLAASDAG